MASVSESQNVLPLAESLNAQPSEDKPPADLALCWQDLDQSPQDPGQTMANIALSQTWSFAAVPASPVTPESASSRTVQSSSQRDMDVAVSENIQGTVPETSGSDVVRSEASRFQVTSQVSLSTEICPLQDTQTPPAANGAKSGGLDDEEDEDDGDDDILAALRRCRNKVFRPTEAQAIRGTPWKLGDAAANNTLPALARLDKTAGDGKVLPIVASTFLTRYDYAGYSRRDAEAEEPTTSDEPPKRRELEVIDLTDLPDPVPGNEGKRKRLDEHGRKKRHRSERGGSQAREKRSSSHRHSSGKRQSDSRSSSSRKGNELSPRQKHRHRDKDRERPPHRELLGRSNQQLQQESPQISQREPRQQLVPGIPDKEPPPQQQSAAPAQQTHQESRTVQRIRPAPAYTRSSGQLVAAANKAPAVGGHLPVASPEDDAEFFHSLSSKQPEKHRAQLVQSLPSADRQLNPNSCRGTSQRPAPAGPPPRHAPVPAAPNHTTSRLPQSRNIFQPQAWSARPSNTPQPRTDIPPVQTILRPPTPPPLPRHSAPYQAAPSLRRQQQLPRAQAQAQARAQAAAQHTAGFPPPPPPPPLLGKPIPALHAFGPDRTAIHYVVYRTPRFTPAPSTTTTTTTAARHGTTTSPTAAAASAAPSSRRQQDEEEEEEESERQAAVRQTRAIACSTHASAAQANAQAAARLGRLRRGVVGQSWRMVAAAAGHAFLSSSSSSSSSLGAASSVGAAGAGTAAATAGKEAPESAPVTEPVLLYEGKVVFDGGGVQFFWVAEELRDLEEWAAAAGGGGVWVDSGRAGVYTRKSGGGGGDDDDDDSDDDDEDDGPEPEDPPLRPSPSPSPPALTPYKPLLDQLDIQTALHSSYTTLAQANRAALATFLDLARPKNMAMEDHHHYRYFVEPDATARFEAGGFGASTCAEPARIEWDPPAKKYRWPFVRLVVEVAASELRGPVEIGDMVVEGPKGGGDGEGVGIGVGGGGRGGQRVGRANQAVVSSRTVDDARSKPAAALPSPAEEESEEDVSEEE
ncbi:e3e7478d-bfad-42c4-aa0f-79cce413870b [Thermothielavioides terrestris]|uniref:E3e7478d-bfad-42c4-aa0f-79cce413870b n=1 Tax=Thermothielavioides terrestris TaxID=2587410 RepID=A0A446BK90_9PEZI|nr:e3e7478d-bfad-42c4-aa0f-79cce413870b [Thermothielavioides terrestris]